MTKKSADKARPASEMPLRVRKKMQTRRQIADAAAALFATRGYDAVTVADIARQAEVSEQTVYNFFPSKEQLVIDEDAAFEARLVGMIRGRPAGTRIADAVRAGAHAFLSEAGARPKGPKSRGGLPYLVTVSPALRRAWLAAVERYAHAIAAVLIEESRGALPPLAAKVLGVSVAAIFSAILDEIGEGTRQRTDMSALVEKLRAQIDDAVNRTAHGLNSAAEG
jgi:AcrR family transcriptional regulator